MTAQVPERITLDGQEHALFVNLLSDWFELSETTSPFKRRSTALWRGYVGRWAIEGGRLYLLSLNGSTGDDTEVGLDAIFPGWPRVFAHWYSGTLRVPLGRQLTYQHMGYGSRYERDLMIDVRRGVVTGTREIHNGDAEPGTTENKGPAAFTTLPASRGDGQ
jgi:hypothetical protein